MDTDYGFFEANANNFLQATAKLYLICGCDRFKLTSFKCRHLQRCNGFNGFMVGFMHNYSYDRLLGNLSFY